METEGTLNSNFDKAQIIFTPKHAKTFRRNKNYRQISLMNIDIKVLKKILTN